MSLENIQHLDKFHAHVYFDDATTDQARALCENAGESFDVIVGRHHEKLVGPHPRWSCQLAFDRVILNELVSWLAAHRNNLTIFIHGLSGDDLADHTDYVSWLGDPVELNLDMFRAK